MGIRTRVGAAVRMAATNSCKGSGTAC